MGSLQIRLANVTIANGATESDVIPLFTYGNIQAMGYQLPSAFTGVAMTWKVSADGTTYVPLYDITGTAVSTTVAASRGFDVPGEVVTWPYAKLVSGSSEAADRTIMLVARVDD